MSTMDKSNGLARFIQIGLLIIVAGMPFHAFLSVWLGSLLGHQAAIQSWKEVLLLALAGASTALIIREPERLNRLKQPWIYLTLALVALALIVTAITRPHPFLAAFGAKADLEFLLAGLIAVVVANKAFLIKLMTVILFGAAAVTIFVVLQIFFLPADFLTHFGYGKDTILPYQHLAEGSQALRFPGTLGGPNQLGTYLILPLCLSIALFIRQRRWWQIALFATSLVSLSWTFSRSAWAGAAIAVAITAVAVLPQRLRRIAVYSGGMVLVGALLALPVIIAQRGELQYLILHSSVENHDQGTLSDSLHAYSLREGTLDLIREPLGHGLGTAGPATLRIGPSNVIENYYLQLGYEAGVLAAALFIAIVALVIRHLWRQRRANLLAVPVAATFIGISLVALLLPAWVDSTTALIAWICAGTLCALPPEDPKHV